MTGTGIHTVDNDTYHADPADTPSLNAGIAKILCEKSPAHAWVAHPRLNPNFQKKDEDKFSVGTVAHELLLLGLDRMHVVSADSWRTNAAKEQRDLARQHGQIPLLIHDRDAVVEMVDAIRAQLEQRDDVPPLFVGGQVEQMLMWDEAGVTCRAKPDWIADDFSVVADLKTTTRSAQPAAWIKSSLFTNGYDIQAALYRRGVKALTGITPEWRWVVVECSPPYALSVIGPHPQMWDLADEKVDHAVGVWRDCLATGEWPSYSSRVAFADVPAYEVTRWMERTVAEEAVSWA